MTVFGGERFTERGVKKNEQYKVTVFHSFIAPGITGFHVHVDDNGDVEFNMTLLDLVKTANGERGKFNCRSFSLLKHEKVHI